MKINKRKKILVTVLVFALLISASAFVIPQFARIINRMSEADTQSELMQQFTDMTVEEIIDEMNVLMSSSGENDGLYHVLELGLRLDSISGEFLLKQAGNSSLNPLVRSTMLDLYDEKMGNMADFTSLAKMLIDEDEDEDVRIKAIYALPDENAQVYPLLESLFFTTENQRVAYHALKHLWIYDSSGAEKIADKVLADYENFSPEQLCASLMAKKTELQENTALRSDDELFDKTEKFAQLCIYIHENYAGRISEELWNNPVHVAVLNLAETGTKISAEYILGKEGFLSVNRLDSETSAYICRKVIRQNCRSLLELAKNSDKTEDIELLLTTTKYIPYKEIVDELQKKLDKDRSAGWTIQYPETFDGHYPKIADENEYISVWR
ncbi:MAG: hypothetical protein E7218_03355 [Anaerofustis stercorihominis]|nr:hypothetical protein [Anaerofustis stercorihominis]